MKKYTLKESTNLYHLSMERMDGRVLYPRIPESRADNEDSITKRVCFSTSIRGCIKAICAESISSSAYIYEPADMNKIKDNVFVPSVDEVPDVRETREKWVTCPVKMKLVGVVQIKPGVFDKFNTKVTSLDKSVITTNLYGNPVSFISKFQAENYDLIIKDFKEIYDEYLDECWHLVNQEKLVNLFERFYHCMLIHNNYSHFLNCSVNFNRYSFKNSFDELLENPNHPFYSDLNKLSKNEQFECIGKFGQCLNNEIQRFTRYFTQQ